LRLKGPKAVIRGTNTLKNKERMPDGWQKFECFRESNILDEKLLLSDGDVGSKTNLISNLYKFEKNSWKILIKLCL
jgi:hypothetical protein